jgi:hypothetical protein
MNRNEDGILFMVVSWWMFLKLVLRSRTPLHKECMKHNGHKGDPGVTPGTCGAGGKKTQVILVWVRALGIGNVSHPRGLGVMRILECSRTPQLEV